MRRVWLGAGLLAILLTLGLLTGAAMKASVCPDTEDLTAAAEAARRGDWEQAKALTVQVRADWEQMKWAAEMLSDHETLGQIDTAFAQLSACEYADPVGYATLCTAIAQDLQSVVKNHICSWQNIF